MKKLKGERLKYSKQKIESAYAEIFDSLGDAYGLDWRSDPNFEETPSRIAKSLLLERCIGINSENECAKLLKRRFPSKYDGMITVGPISAHSLCPHHMEEIRHEVHFGYIPNPTNKKAVVGLSKIPRVVKLFASQPIMQEDFCKKLADIFGNHLKPEGLGLIIRSKHYCMIARGVREHESVTSSIEMRGSFRNDPSVKQEFIELIKMKNFE